MRKRGYLRRREEEPRLRSATEKIRAAYIPWRLNKFRPQTRDQSDKKNGLM